MERFLALFALALAFLSHATVRSSERLSATFASQVYCGVLHAKGLMNTSPKDCEERTVLTDDGKFCLVAYYDEYGEPAAFVEGTCIERDGLDKLHTQSGTFPSVCAFAIPDKNSCVYFCLYSV